MTSPRPDVIPPSRWSQPLPELTRLDNGLTLATVHLPGQQLASLRLVVPHDLAAEGEGKEGASMLMARLLDEGAHGYDAQAFSLALERQGAGFGAGAQEGAVSVDLDVPARRLVAGLDLAALAVQVPTFPADQVDRLRRARLAEIDHETASAPHRAARELIGVLWAPGSRAATPTAGTAASVAALTRDDVVERHHGLSPADATMVVAGDLTGLDVTAAVASAFGSWSSFAPTPARPLPPTPAGGGTRIVLVDRPGSVQSELALAIPAVGRVHPDWPALRTLAYLLGGSPNARLDADLRESKGWTYGLRASLRPRAAGGSFVIGGSVRSEVTAPALESISALLAALPQGFSASEVSAGVDFLTRATPTRWATADVVADELSALAIEGLPWDFPQSTVEALGSLASDDLTAAWGRLGDPGWAMVVVGDAAQCHDPIFAAGLAPVTVVPAGSAVLG